MKRDPKQYITDTPTPVPEPKHSPEREADNASVYQPTAPADALIQPKVPADPAERSSAPLKKRRKLSKEQELQHFDRRISAILSIVFFAVVVVIAIYLLAAPRQASSQAERRALAQWPALTADGYIDGTYTGGIARFYDDAVPSRDTFKNIGSQIRSLAGIQPEGTAQLIGSIYKADDAPEPETQPLTEEDAADISAAEEETTTVSSKDYHIDNEEVITENGYLVVRQDGHWRAFSFFTGADINLYADTVNYVRQMIDPSINIYVMPAPLACQFYIPANYLDLYEDMELTFRDLTSKLGSGITTIDIIDELNEHNTEPIYLRTDHHWAHLGAYYAASTFAQNAGVPFAELDSYEKNVRKDYIGTMYALTGSANLLNDPEDFTYYIPTNSYIADYYDPDMTYLFRKGLFFDTSLPDSYGVALGEDDLIIRIITDAKTQRTLLVVKDSFGNAAVPFLTSSFDEIYVIDQRYFNFNLIDYINSIGVTDILFLHDYYSLTGSEAELLEYITYSNLDSEIRDIVPKPEIPAEGNPDINGTGILFAEDVPGYMIPASVKDEAGTDEEDPNNLVHEIYGESFYEDHEETYEDTYEEGSF